MLRKQVQSIYDRQTARCLKDIQECCDIPVMAIERIKRAIEYTCKDVDKLNTNKESGNGTNSTNGNC